MATLPKASLAVTVKDCATPAVVSDGKLVTTRWVAEEWVTTIPVSLAASTGAPVVGSDERLRPDRLENGAH